MGLNKKQIAAVIAENHKMSKKDSLTCVDTVFTEIDNALVKGDEVDIVGFGKFQITNREARTARNPITGESIEVPAKRAVKFKPSKTLKDALNK